MIRKGSFIADQRGAVSFEMPFVFGILIISLLLPIADIAIASFQYISAWQALRAFGQSIQYSTPPDVTNAASWTSTALAKADSKYPISNFRIICGEGGADCSSANNVSPRYYSFTTSITLAPMVLSSVLCPGGSCAQTLPYTERFQ